MNRRLHQALFPADGSKAAAVAIIVTGVVGLITILLAVFVFRDYGYVLFCAVPMLIGVGAPLFYGVGARRTFLQLFGVAVATQFTLFAALLVMGIEGIVCLIMAAPLWMTIAVVGALVAYPIHRAMWRHVPEFGARGFPVVALFMLASLPLFMGAEHAAAPAAPLLMVSTEMEIDAPPEVVWQYVPSFPDLPAPGWGDGGWLFKAGIARPIRAEIDGSGIGATRECVFSTGRAIEPVTAWVPARLLEVDVIWTPPSMEESSPYPHLHPPHLEGYLTSAKARFELVPLANGRTRIVGTSWYHNKMFPVAYWRLWSDASIKAVQVQVLSHIRALSEGDPLQSYRDKK
ncbi:MAG TPA: hypothetical protein VHM90_14915 [Phycisphaerae bacterium]|nr:hypothetical protein [Phycisphaerae bacterium]